jgi:hypothetical protein
MSAMGRKLLLKEVRAQTSSRFRLRETILPFRIPSTTEHHGRVERHTACTRCILRMSEDRAVRGSAKARGRKDDTSVSSRPKLLHSR